MHFLHYLSYKNVLKISQIYIKKWKIKLSHLNSSWCCSGTVPIRRSRRWSFMRHLLAQFPVLVLPAEEESGKLRATPSKSSLAMSSRSSGCTFLGGSIIYIKKLGLLDPIYVWSQAVLFDFYTIIHRYRVQVQIKRIWTNIQTCLLNLL